MIYITLIVLALIAAFCFRMWLQRDEYVEGVPVSIGDRDLLTLVLETEPKSPDMVTEFEETIRNWRKGTELLIIPKGTVLVKTRR